MHVNLLIVTLELMIPNSSFYGHLDVVLLFIQIMYNLTLFLVCGIKNWQALKIPLISSVNKAIIPIKREDMNWNSDQI